MVRLRLRKVGSKGQQSFRLVAAEREHPRDGRFLEYLGSYNPRTDPATITVDEARVYHWLKNGAQPSESVLKLFKVTGTMDRFARFKAGEALETLVAEAEAAAGQRHTTRKTSGAEATRLSRKKKAAAQRAEQEG
ncbi:MAG: 30S ribosomal protein S16 [Anaerolineales bacterium]|nr:30S ribosomal protein S16 [Anaerolineales bacterium]